MKLYSIKYKAKIAIKGKSSQTLLLSLLQAPAQSNLLKGWTLNVDGASNSKGTRIRIVDERVHH